MKHYRKRLTDIWLGIALVLSVQLAWSQEPKSEPKSEPKAFTARYQVRFYGLSGGILQLTLHKGSAPAEFVYESHAEPSLLGGFMISDSARESSNMTIDDNGVRPLNFFSDDGKKGDEKDSNIQFDWNQKRMTGRSERVDFNQEIPARMQDHLSIQIAIMQALQQGSELGDFTLIDAGEIKQYTYTKEGPGTVKYKDRTLDATILRSQRTGEVGGRINRYWHAPEFGNLVVRAERSRDGKIDLVMNLVDVKFAE